MKNLIHYMINALDKLIQCPRTENKDYYQGSIYPLNLLAKNFEGKQRGKTYPESHILV